MGNKCCTDRKDPVTRQVPGNAPEISGAKEHRKSSAHAGNAYAGGKRSLGYSSKGGDAEKFEKAMENDDLKTFVELLKSMQSIDSFEERMHPWAEDPKTVGALAGTQLAILATVAQENEDQEVKNKIREAGAIPPLVGFLRSDQEDRVQTAVVALMALTAECPDNAVAAYDAGALPLLMQHVDSKMVGMRVSSATTLRNICTEVQEGRKEFVRLGGLTALVRQLDPVNVSPGLNLGEMQLETVLNLQDLLEDESGEIIEEYAKEAVGAGAKSKLLTLTQADDEEVRGSAEELLNSLSKYS